MLRMIAALTAMALLPVAADAAQLQTCVAATTDDTPARMFAHPDRFDCRRRQTDFGRGDFWILSQPIGTDSAPLRVKATEAWEDDLALYALYRDGAVERLPKRDRTISQSFFAAPGVNTALPERRGGVVRLLWHVTGSANVRGIVINPQVLTVAQAYRATLEMTAAYAGFAGLCLALLVYNFVLWIAVRRPFQLAYCTMVAGLLLYAMATWNMLGWILPPWVEHGAMRLSYVTLAMSTAASLWFARTMFEPNILAGWPERLMKGLTAALLVTAIAYAGLVPWHMQALDRLHGLCFAIMIAMTGPIAWRAWARGSRYRWYFAVGWATPILLAFMRVANTFHVLPFVVALRAPVLMLMAVEALLSSLAIAYRIHLLGRERDHARAQEMVAQLLADTDPLTGLMNRRAFLANALGRSRDQMLLLIDIDHFKRINDTIGHDGGDEVLRVIARALREASPPGALVARLGGEEFAILLDDGADPQDAALPAGVLNSLRRARMPYDLNVTASIGTCRGALRHDADWKHMYRLADRALFAAKSAGRDRCRDAASLPIAA